MPVHWMACEPSIKLCQLIEHSFAVAVSFWNFTTAVLVHNVKNLGGALVFISHFVLSDHPNIEGSAYYWSYKWHQVAAFLRTLQISFSAGQFGRIMLETCVWRHRSFCGGYVELRAGHAVYLAMLPRTHWVFVSYCECLSLGRPNLLCVALVQQEWDCHWLPTYCPLHLPTVQLDGADRSTT